jgi:CRP/FNR family transcriptional regulator
LSIPSAAAGNTAGVATVYGLGLTGLRERECRGLVERLRHLEVVPPARRYKVGESVFMKGEPADGLYVLTEGLIKLSKRYSGVKEVSLRLIGPWETFGDLAPGVPLVQGVRAHALTDCEVVKIPKVFIERALRTDREASARLVTLMGLELAYGREIVGCLLPPTTDARLAVLLPVLAERFGRTDGDGAVVLPPLTHFDLAVMVATTRESVTTAMKSLRRQGLINKEGRTVTILKLRELAGVAQKQAHVAGTYPDSETGVEFRDGTRDMP